MMVLMGEISTQPLLGVVSGILGLCLPQRIGEK